MVPLHHMIAPRTLLRYPSVFQAAFCSSSEFSVAPEASTRSIDESQYLAFSSMLLYSGTTNKKQKKNNRKPIENQKTNKNQEKENR